MKKLIYHGSPNIVDKPMFGYGKKHNDYGLGFYCTESLELAKEWSVTSDRDGFVNSYLLDMSDLDVLDLTSGDFSVLNWLAILLENRIFDRPSHVVSSMMKYVRENFLPDYKRKDIVIGYRADDSYFSYAQDFLNGTIPYRMLADAMKLGNLGIQIVLRSEKSFGKISFIEHEKVEKDIWYPKKENRDRIARMKYMSKRNMDWGKNDLFMIDILRGGIKDGDPRL